MLSLEAKTLMLRAGTTQQLENLASRLDTVGAGTAHEWNLLAHDKDDGARRPK